MTTVARPHCRLFLRQVKRIGDALAQILQSLLGLEHGFERVVAGIVAPFGVTDGAIEAEALVDRAGEVDELAVGAVGQVHRHVGDARFARRIFEFVSEARHQQDNEQWHLLILVEMIAGQGVKEGLLRFRLLPQLIAFFYYHVSWLLYVIKPGLSYELNAHFEDHAEHEYMEYVREHPELETTPFVSEFEKDYGRFASQADLFRQIGLDERQHKLESLERMERPRFA